MCKILIVEDDRQTNLAICEYLCSIGYTTLSAFDGSEALSIFSQNTILGYNASEKIGIRCASPNSR